MHSYYVLGYLQVDETDSVNFTCETQGGPGNTYQWLRNTEVLSGETNKVLSLENVTISDEGRYTCNVTNLGGSGISNDATLISTCVHMYSIVYMYRCPVNDCNMYVVFHEMVANVF